MVARLGVSADTRPGTRRTSNRLPPGDAAGAGPRVRRADEPTQLRFSRTQGRRLRRDADGGQRRRAPRGHRLRSDATRSCLVAARCSTQGHHAWQFPSGSSTPVATAATSRCPETLADTGIHCLERGVSCSLFASPYRRQLPDFLCDYSPWNVENRDLVETRAALLLVPKPTSLGLSHQKRISRPSGCPGGQND